MIKIVSKEEVQKRKFGPEPHTVQFNDDGVWYAYLYAGKIESVLCVSDKHGGKYISSCYTSPEYRKRGLQSSLIMRVCEDYPESKIIAHCLQSSKRVFEGCGFYCYKTVNYKYGTQYFMRLDR